MNRHDITYDTENLSLFVLTSVLPRFPFLDSFYWPPLIASHLLRT